MKRKYVKHYSTLHHFEFTDGETGSKFVPGKNKPYPGTHVWVYNEFRKVSDATIHTTEVLFQ